MRKIYLISLFAIATFAAQAQGTTFPNQDCVGATPLCTHRYDVPDNQLVGPGAVPGEIPSGSCLSSNEHQTSWYTFTVTQSGLLSFAIIPTDADSVNLGTATGLTDYDWAVFLLPPGQTAAGGGCAAVTASSSTQVACNFSGAKGATGLISSPGGGSTAVSAPISATAGQIFVLAVDNYLATTIGYRIQFFTDSSGYASLGPPTDHIKIKSVYYDTTCQATTCPIYLQLSHAVNCDSLTITLVDSAYHPSSSSFTAGCFSAAVVNGMSDQIEIHSDVRVRDTSNFVILSYHNNNGSLTDPCGHVVSELSDTVRMKPYLRYYHVPAPVATATLVAAGVGVSPNPFTNHLVADLRALPGQPCTVRLIAITGAEVVAPRHFTGGHQETVAVPEHLPAGIYIAEILAPGGALRLRMTKE